MSEEIPASQLKHAWESQQTPTINELARPIQNAPVTSMPSTSLVSVSRYNPQNYPQYGIVTEHQVQPKYQSWSPQITQTNVNTVQPATQSKSCSNFITAKLVIGLLIGVIVCGVPMGVMTALYVQAKASSNNSTANTGSSGSATTSSSSLPSQCTSNTILSDAYRVYTYAGCCYTSDCSLTASWYRITGLSGSQLLTTPISMGYCGETYPSWFNGSFPSTVGATTSGGMCVNVGGTLCPSSYSTTVSVTNCNGYYVFYLVPFPYCNVRYCTM